METDYCAFRVTLHTQRLVGRGFKYPSVFLRLRGLEVIVSVLLVPICDSSLSHWPWYPSGQSRLHA